MGNMFDDPYIYFMFEDDDEEEQERKKQERREECRLERELNGDASTEDDEE
jgi:hypothetical protein